MGKRSGHKPASLRDEPPVGTVQHAMVPVHTPERGLHHVPLREVERAELDPLDRMTEDLAALEGHADRVRQALVIAARAAGESWASIGRRVGVSPATALRTWGAAELRRA